jgi:hypothetical protein
MVGGLFCPCFAGVLLLVPCDKLSSDGACGGCFASFACFADICRSPRWRSSRVHLRHLTVTFSGVSLVDF